jgi:hypothetical protein
MITVLIVITVTSSLAISTAQNGSGLLSNMFLCIKTAVQLPSLPHILHFTVLVPCGGSEESKNNLGHAAGGARPGSGRKRKQSVDNTSLSQSICK